MKVLLVSGGSGGHLMPAMALAERLRSSDRCSVLSTRRPVDQILAAAQSPVNGDWATVDLQQFSPLWKWALPWHTARQIRAVWQVWSAVARSKPDVVVGFGGYLSAVGLMAARGAGVPAVLHEQNVLPGRANRMFCRLADAVAVSFPETKGHFPAQVSVQVTGNPIRFQSGGVSREKARAEFGFDLERPVLLVMGGSQGSSAVNSLAVEIWKRQSPQERGKVQILHLAGPKAAEVESAYRQMEMQARVFPFLHGVETALAAATLAISRAGATGIAEMVQAGLPAILIPYPYAQAHQLANARWMESTSGARVFEEQGLTPERLGQEVRGLLWNSSQLERMGQALSSKADGRAAERLAQLVHSVARRS